MAPEKIAGLVLNYRTSKSTFECMESLIREGVSQVLIIDNSEDAGHSAAEIAELMKRRPPAAAVWVEPAPKNLGFAAGVNLGLRLLRTRVGECAVMLINSDAVATPGMLAAMQAATGPTDAPTLVEAEEVDGQGRPRDIVRHYHRALGLFLRRPLPGTFRFVSGCCLLIPAPLARPPLFDEDFFFYGEDVELSWRLGRAGTRIVHSNDARVIHAGGASSRPSSYFYEYHITLGHLTLARKLARGGMERTLFSLLRVLTLGSRALVRSLRSRRLTPLSACMDAYMAKRRAVTPDPEG